MCGTAAGLTQLTGSRSELGLRPLYRARDANVIGRTPQVFNRGRWKWPFYGNFTRATFFVMAVAQETDVPAATPSLLIALMAFPTERRKVGNIKQFAISFAERRRRSWTQRSQGYC